MSFARSAITPLSTHRVRPATPQTSCVPELRQDRVRHSLQGGYVVHLQPLQHYPLHAGFGEMSEPLDDLARRPGEDRGGEVMPQLPFELAVYVGLCVAEEDAGRQRPPHTVASDDNRRPSWTRRARH